MRGKKTQIGDALTKKQRRILDFIVESQRTGPSPTISEIMNRFGIKSQNGVVCHLKAMEKQGYLKQEPLHARSIEVLDTGRAETLWGSFAV